jgi:hypothetical protein
MAIATPENKKMNAVKNFIILKSFEQVRGRLLKILFDLKALFCISTHNPATLWEIYP